MPKTRRRYLIVCLISTVFVNGTGSMIAAQRERGAWPLIKIPDPQARRATVAALEKASTLLADPECQKVLTDFQDGNGRPLADRLSSLAAMIRHGEDPRGSVADIQDYLTMVTFMDGTRSARCAGGALAFTVPGSRVVRICGDALKRISAQQAEYVAAAMVHEILHTLGLGENPPSSKAITARVLARCGGA
jgi:hypothetical protein